MGMFDYVKVEEGVELPDFEPDLESRSQFQTKDFDCTMGLFKITEDGKLLEEQYDWNTRSEEEMERIKEEEGPLAALQGSIQRTSIGWEERDFHGIMEFYNGEHRYEAKFTDGELEDITLIEKPVASQG